MLVLINYGDEKKRVRVCVCVCDIERNTIREFCRHPFCLQILSLNNASHYRLTVLTRSTIKSNKNKTKQFTELVCLIFALDSFCSLVVTVASIQYIFFKRFRILRSLIFISLAAPSFISLLQAIHIIYSAYFFWFDHNKVEIILRFTYMYRYML